MKIKNKNQFKIIATFSLCILFIVGVICNGILKSKLIEPENPMDNNVAKNSEVLLQSSKLMADVSNIISPEDNRDKEQNNDNKSEDIKNQLNEKDDINDELSNEEENKNQQSYKNEENNKEKSSNIQGGENKKEENTGNNGTIQVVDDNDGDEINEYFSTTIEPNEVVTEPLYRFTIKHLNKKLQVVNMSILLNENDIPSFGGKIFLDKGDNFITIKVTYENRKGEKILATKKYKVTYKAEDIVIYTDLAESMNVSEKGIKFYAYSKQGKDFITTKVKVNGQVLSSDSDNYVVDLNEGSNIVEITAGGKGDSLKKEFSINYKPIERSVVIHTDLSNRAVESSTLQFEAYAEYVAGEASSEIGLNIVVNGNTIPNSQNHIYSVNLNEGNNTVKLFAQKDDKKEVREFTIVYVKENEEKPTPSQKGTITISLEAGTVGLGNIIAPTQYSITIGEKASTVVDRLLNEYGIGYKSTGSIEDNFYLARIYKTGVARGSKIPDKLRECLENDGFYISEITDENSLGEFDFCEKSGWMVSVNGKQPGGLGLSDYILKDGDVIRLRFTTCIGRDLGFEFDGQYGDW